MRKNRQFKKLLDKFEMDEISSFSDNDTEHDNPKDLKNDEKEKFADPEEIIENPQTEWQKHEINIEELKSKALETYEQLFDLGINADPRHADKFLEAAVKSLEIALDAEKTKIDKKMEIIKTKMNKKKLELEERRIKIQERLNNIYDIKENEEDVLYIDRNKLLQQLSMLKEEEKDMLNIKKEENNKDNTS